MAKLDRNCWYSAAIIAAVAVAGPATAAGFDDPDWPCVQRKVVHLSIGQMWTAALPPEDANWRQDEEIALLAPILAARRTSMERAEELIASFPAGPDRNERLTVLFAGVFYLIEKDRAVLIDGITKYARKQKELSELIDAEQTEIATARQTVAEDDYDALDLLEEREDKVSWDTRIYQERNRSLTYVCESPVILEKRAFALARLIQAQLAE